MSDSIPPPNSAVRVWLRVLAWIIPGVCAPAILLGWFAVSYGASHNQLLITTGVFTLFAAILLGCGFFNAILRQPERATRRMSPAKSITLSIIVFILFQILLVPAIGCTVAFGCNIVMGNL